MRNPLIVFLSFILLLGFNPKLHGWGFFSHRKINRHAVFSLPPEMIVFYKKYIDEVSEKAVDADKRRHTDDAEAPRHYVDIDVYGDSAIYTMPRYWNDAVEKYSEDTLLAYGIVPWHVNVVRYRLISAFKEKNLKKIIQYSADLGHYIADAHVPLHTTQNYNGQLTGQKGIHAFWETRLPEMYSEDYNFFVGRAEYISQPQTKIWEGVTSAHMALDSVLRFEKELSMNFSEDKKFSYEKKGERTFKVYSEEFSKAFHDKLSGQVERQMQRSIKMIADFWYTCWLDAGQPDLSSIPEPEN